MALIKPITVKQIRRFKHLRILNFKLFLKGGTINDGKVKWITGDSISSNEHEINLQRVKVDCFILIHSSALVFFCSVSSLLVALMLNNNWTRERIELGRMEVTSVCGIVVSAHMANIDSSPLLSGKAIHLQVPYETGRHFGAGRPGE
jgi:hypothetical protein